MSLDNNIIYVLPNPSIRVLIAGKSLLALMIADALPVDNLYQLDGTSCFGSTPFSIQNCL
jgi:hypothetical protein